VVSRAWNLRVARTAHSTLASGYLLPDPIQMAYDPTKAIGYTVPDKAVRCCATDLALTVRTERFADEMESERRPALCGGNWRKS
jgi:hypothetical protein